MLEAELSHARACDESTLERLLERCAADRLADEEHATLERHLAGCPDCAAELEAMKTFAAVVAEAEGDAGLDRAAIAGAMARLGAKPTLAPSSASHRGDEALDRIAVDLALAQLGASESFAARLRRWWRPAAGFVALGAVAAAAVLLAWRPAETPPAPSASTTMAASRARPVILHDGSEITPDDARAQVQVGEDSPTNTLVRLGAGTARFRVRHDPARMFRVEAGPVRIEDLGTVFRVAYEPGAHVRVTVSEGRVAVLGPAAGARFELGAGEDRVLSLATPTAQEPSLGNAAPRPARVSAPRANPTRAPARAHPTDDPAELLAAADDARRARRPATAVASLRRLVDHHPGDPRAPSAAFTLGWVLLTDLDRPREAAQAFAEAERIAPRGTLAEDAAARVVEAWQKAGESGRATEAARRYLRLYASGRYTGLMRGLVGEH